MGLIVDSGVFIQAERKVLPLSQLFADLTRRFPSQTTEMSVVTLAELTHGVYRARTVEQASRRREFIDRLLQIVRVRTLGVRLAREVGRIEGEQAARGFTIDFPDLVIGTTALALDYAVLTTNPGHFRLIPNLRVESF